MSTDTLSNFVFVKGNVIRGPCGIKKLPLPDSGCATTAATPPTTDSVGVMSSDTLSGLDGLMPPDALSDSDSEVGRVFSKWVASVNSNCVSNQSPVGTYEHENSSHPGARSAADVRPSEEPPASPSVKTKSKGETHGGNPYGFTAAPMSKLRNATGPFFYKYSKEFRETAGRLTSYQRRK